MVLSQTERDEMLSALTGEQQEFLLNHVKRGKRTMFARVIARYKGIAVTENMTAEDLERLIDDWRLIDFQDAGPNWRDTSDLKCECGRLLRRQYTVENRVTGEVLRFGEQHFEEHTGISPRIVMEVKNGFVGIDYELDELLVKMKNAWRLTFDMPDGFEVPEEYTLPMGLGIPLLDRQEKRLYQLIRDFEESKWGFRRLNVQPIRTISTDQILPSRAGLFSDNDQEYSDHSESGPVPTVLSHDQEQFILQCIDEGIESARVICELMVKRGVARKDRYTTGKPFIYPLVCLFLEHTTGIRCVKISGPEDRWYKRVDIHSKVLIE